MNRDLFEELLSKYLDNSINSHELDVFLQLLQEENNAQILRQVEIIIKEKSNNEISSGRRDKIFNTILQSIEEKNSLKPKPFLKSIYIKAVGIAALLFCTFTITYFIFNAKNSVSKSITADSQDVVHHEGQIIIRHEDGKEVMISDNRSQQYQLGNLDVSVDGKGYISYEIKKTNADLVQPITIETPKGKNTHIKFNDGTEMWLNTMSKVTFIPDFKSNSRDVQLEGEGFFEVAHDSKRPFRVSTNKTTVEVLGTGFNISAYNGENEYTTLVHGKVKVNSAGTNKMLNPGQQFKLAKDASHTIRDVEVEEFISWKSGDFVFNKKNIKEVLYQLNKWYDIKGVEIINDSKDTFTGTFKNDRSLRNVLDQLELVSSYHFKIQNGIITVN